MSDILTTVAVSFATALATRGAEGPAQTIDDLWYMGFGHWSHLAREKRRIIIEQKIEKFKQKAIDEALKIPEENIQEPRASILGPTLEAARYYYDEDVLRDMFAKLIASSIDSSKNNTLRSSFVEIIKQLEPIDALNLKLFKNIDILPICRLGVLEEDGLASRYLTDVLFHSNPEYPDISSHSSSLYNLQRLGLVEMHFDGNLTDNTLYDPFTNSTLASEIEKQLKYGLHGKNSTLKMTKGYVARTNLGKDFISICL